MTWFVVFFPARGMLRRPWWLAWLHRGYAHCLACRAEGETRTLIMDHRGRRLRADAVRVPIGTFLGEMLAQPDAPWILAVDCAAPADGPEALLRPPMTCVEVVKAALGLSAPFVLTPRQLARHLRGSMGARPVLPIPTERSPS